MFRFMLYSDNQPFMGCSLRTPVLSFLFQEGVWKPRMNREQVSRQLDSAGEVNVVFDGDGRVITYRLIDTKF